MEYMDKIRFYVKELFGELAQSEEAREQQEELISNLNLKAADYIAAGMSEDEAFSRAVATLKSEDMTELLDLMEGRRYLKNKLTFHATVINALFIFLSQLVLYYVYMPENGYKGNESYALIIIAAAMLIWIGINLAAYIHQPRATERWHSRVTKTGILTSVGGWILLSAVLLLINRFVMTAYPWSVYALVCAFVWPMNSALTAAMKNSGHYNA